MPLKDARKCNAKAKSTGQQCQCVAVKTSAKCRKHGGKSPKGIASPNYKDGRHSKYAYLPEHLSKRVGEFLKDEKLTELRESIAVCDARLTELYERVNTKESGDAWKEIQEYTRTFKSNLKFNILPSAKDVETLCELATKGVSDRKIWEEIGNQTELRRRLVESESKRIKDSQQIITSEQFLSFIQFVLSVIKENVTDPKQLNTISEKFIGAGISNSR